MTTELARAVVFAFGMTLTLAYACHSPATESTVYIDTGKIPAELRADYASFAMNCSKCHSLSRAFNAHVTSAAHWDLYVARMMRTAGSAISPNEAPKILRFLHWYTRSYDKVDGVTSALEPEGSEGASLDSVPAVPAPPTEPATTATESPGVQPASTGPSLDDTRVPPSASGDTQSATHEEQGEGQR